MDVQKQLCRHLKFPEIKLWLSRNNCGAPNMLKGILKSTMAVPKHCEAPIDCGCSKNLWSSIFILGQLKIELWIY